MPRPSRAYWPVALESAGSLGSLTRSTSQSPSPGSRSTSKAITGSSGLGTQTSSAAAKVGRRRPGRSTCTFSRRPHQRLQHPLAGQLADEQPGAALAVRVAPVGAVLVSDAQQAHPPAGVQALVERRLSSAVGVLE